MNSNGNRSNSKPKSDIHNKEESSVSSVSHSEHRKVLGQSPKTSINKRSYTVEVTPSDPGNDERSEGEYSSSSSGSSLFRLNLPTKPKSPNSDESTKEAKKKSFINTKENGSSTEPGMLSDESDAVLEIDTSFEDDSEGTNENKVSRNLEEKDVKSITTNEEPSTITEKSNLEESRKIRPVEEANVCSEAMTEDLHINKLKDQLAVEFKVTLPSIPNLVEGNSQFLRMPNFIPVEPIPYDAQAYTDTMSAEDLKSKQSRDNFISRLKTTIRWRENQNEVGGISKESNARIVRWSDGSETFHVGAEVFDIMHHPVPDDQNQLYVRLDNFYQVQTSIKDKMTLRPKLDSTFGQSHVQGLRDRALKPQTGCVKVLMDMGTNPVLDRQRKIKEELAQLKKDERERRRIQQLNMKPRIKPMHHCTADDSDLDEADSDDQDKESTMSPNEIGQGNRPGLRTNRNATTKPATFKETDADDESVDNEDEDDDEDINDIINDDDLDYEEEADTEDTSSEEEQKKVQKRNIEKSNDTQSDDSDIGRNFKCTKRKVKYFTYSDSDN